MGRKVERREKKRGEFVGGERKDGNMAPGNPASLLGIQQEINRKSINSSIHLKTKFKGEIMIYNTYQPVERLRPFIKYYALTETEAESTYKVFPTTGMVLGFQYRGQLAVIHDGSETPLYSAGITGISDAFKLFKNRHNTGSILVYFTETGFAHFATPPANELFNLSISLDHIFEKNLIAEVEEKLSLPQTDTERIIIVEQFFLSQLKEKEMDKLVIEAVKLIYQSRGTIRIKELGKRLFISQSPLEKRFRRTVGVSPKKFASIIRFNTVLDAMCGEKSLADICYENQFFDQAHFIKDFKQYTGETPDGFRSIL